MKTYARIQSGTIAELFATDQDIATLFNPQLQWVDVTGQSVQVGWLQGTAGFTAPPPPAVPASSAPTLAGLQAQLATLTAQIAALQPHS